VADASDVTEYNESIAETACTHQYQVCAVDFGPAAMLTGAQPGQSGSKQGNLQ
jgi:hypothetical protein